MKFAVAHKTATYLMVGFALIAMVGGGGIAPVFALGGFAAFVVSWWWEPPLIKYEKWSWVWSILSVFALLYSVLTAIVTGDFLGVGAQFLVWLVVVKAYNRRAARDWQQLYLLAFLMLVAGSVLNADVTFGLCFLGFVISSTWALTMFHLRREMEDNLLVKHAADRASERVEVRRILESKRIVGGRFFLGTGLLSFAVFIASAALFLALPRVGMGFFLKSRGGMTLAGFSDGVKLGGHGVIKNDATVVMRVEMAAKFGGRSAPYIHWRGVAFDQYIRGQWSRSARAPRSATASNEIAGGLERWYQTWPNAPYVDASFDLDAGFVRQDVWLDPLDSNVLFGATTPRAYEIPRTVRSSVPKAMQNDEFRSDHGSTIHYKVWSQLNEPTAAAMQAAGTEVPPGFEVFVELPNEITERTRELARQITANAATNYDKVVAIKAWLGQNLTYTLKLEDPGKQEPVDFFLFDRKKGHCEYFASAFAILARAVGIPVRNVNGFLGGEWNEYKGYVAVRAGDAHSWDEVYFPDVGWVTFDPTPAGGDELGRGGSGWTAKLGRWMDSLRFQWSKWVIDYDLASQLSLFKSIGRGIKSGAIAVKNALAVVKDVAVDHWPISIGIGCVIVVIGILRRKRRPRGLVVRDRRVVRVRSPIAEVFDQVAKQLAKAGFARESGTTPRELASRLARTNAPAAAQVGELVELYYLAEWGTRRDPAAETRAVVLAGEIRSGLATARVRKRTG